MLLYQNMSKMINVVRGILVINIVLGILVIKLNHCQCVVDRLTCYFIFVLKCVLLNIITKISCSVGLTKICFSIRYRSNGN